MAVDIAAIDRMRGKAEQERSLWENLWRDAAKFAVPRHQFYDNVTAGQERSKNVFEDQCTESSERLAAALFGMLTNPAIKWFHFGAANDRNMRDTDTQNWLLSSRDNQLRAMNNPRTQVNMSLHEAYLDLVVFGTAILFIKEIQSSDMFRVQSVPLNECFIVENEERVVDTLFRQYKLSVQQAVNDFGLESLSEDVRDKYEKGKTKEDVEIVHAVSPRHNRDFDRIDSRNKPWASVYYEKQNKHILRESGFDEFPFVVARWKRYTGEVYGRSPTTEAITRIRISNALMKTTLVSTQKAADPPMQVPDNGFIGPLRFNPGGINYYRSGRQDRAEPVQTGANPAVSNDVLQLVLAGIRRSYFEDLLMLPEQDRMTAEEVMRRQQDRMQLLAPILGRLQSELLGPTVGRIFGIMHRRNAFDEIPDGLREEGEVQVDYVSPMAHSQTAGEADNLQRFLATMSPIFQIQPDAAEKIDGDSIASRVGRIFHLPEEYLVDQDTLDQRRMQRMQAQQLQEQAQASSEAASAARDAAEAEQIQQSTTPGIPV